MFASASPDRNLDYAAHPSTKIEVAVNIIHHHLASPNRGPLKQIKGQNELIPDEEAEAKRPPNTDTRRAGADKIIMFIMFPDSMWLISRALDHHGIKHLTLTGRTSAAERTTVLEQFRRSADTHVLIVSSVAITGLNLWFARILIIMVRVLPLPLNPVSDAVGCRIVSGLPLRTLSCVGGCNACSRRVGCFSTVSSLAIRPTFS